MRSTSFLPECAWRVLTPVLMLASSAVAADASCKKPLRITLPFFSTDIVCMAQWARAVLQEAGCTLDVQNGVARPTARLLQEVEAGRTDILLDITETPERRALGWFSHPHSSETVRIYVRAGDAHRWPVQTLCDASMQSARVTGPAQGWLGPEWAAVQRKERRCGRVSLYAHNDNVGANALRDGRMDVFVVTDWAVRNLPAQSQRELQPLPVLVHRNTGHMLLSRRVVGEADLQRINAALDDSLARHGPPCGRAPVSAESRSP